MSRKTRAGLAMAMLVAAVSSVGACVQTQRALDEDCLKDQDCLSGICSQLKCAAAPQLLDGAPQGNPTPTPDASTPDAAPDVVVPEASPAETGMEAAADATADADATPEASPDASPDASAE